MKYYLASEKALELGYKFDEVSKPVYSYRKNTILNEKLYIVGISNYEDFEKFFESQDEDDTYGAWTRLCGRGHLNIDELTTEEIVESGISSVIEDHTGLTTETNQAIVVADITYTLGYPNPIDLFNHIHKLVNPDLYEKA